MKPIRLLLGVLLTSFFASQAAAQDQGIAFRGYSGTRLLRPAASDVAAMGTAGAALSEGIIALHTNPAGLAGIPAFQLDFSFRPSKPIQDLGSEDAVGRGIGNRESLSVGARIPYDFAMAINFMTEDLGGGNRIRQYQLGIARRFEWLTMGASLRYADQKMIYPDDFFGDLDYSGTALTLDLGVKKHWQFDESRRIQYCTVGFAVQNLLGEFDPDVPDFSDPAPKFARVGVVFGKLVSVNPFPYLGYLMNIDYQRVLNSDDFTWDHIIPGVQVTFPNGIYGQAAYNVDLHGKKQRTLAGEFDGLSFGFGYRSTSRLFDPLPVGIDVAFSKGVGFDNTFDQTNLSISFAHLPR